MTLAELMEAFRDDACDNGDPPFWSDRQLIRFANEAQNEACRRGDLLVSSSGSISAYDVTVGQDIVPLDSRVVAIKRAILSTGSEPLSPVTTMQMDMSSPGWESDTGQVVGYVTDYQSGAIRPYPIPTVADTLRLTVRHLPLTAMENDEDEPEIRSETHPSLVQWMFYRAYSNPDADAFDPARAAKSLAEFEREFGKKSSARNEQWMRSDHVVGADPIA
jgi:hypothetical protein